MALDVARLFDQVFSPQPEEAFWLLNDGPVGGAEISGDRQQRFDMAREWHAAALDLAGRKGFAVQPLVLYRVDEGDSCLAGVVEQDGKRQALPEFLAGLGPKDVVMVISGPSLTSELMPRVADQKFRCASAPGVTPGVPGFEAAYERIPFRAETLNLRLDVAQTAVVTFTSEGVPGFPKEGVHCTFDLRGQNFHILENGECRMPGRFINLPSGCANIVPYGGGDPDRGPSQTTGELPVAYEGQLVTLSVDQGRITDFNGEGEGIDFWKEKLSNDANTHITKLGLGINDDCRVVGVRVVDEKTQGFHFGFGPTRDFPCVYTAQGPIQSTIRLRYAGDREEVVMNRSVYDATILGAAF